MKGPSKTVFRSVTERLGGQSPNRMRAAVTAVAVGSAVGAGVYRVLRSGDSGE
jgi:hypothetical protein